MRSVRATWLPVAPAAACCLEEGEEYRDVEVLVVLQHWEGRNDRVQWGLRGSIFAMPVGLDRHLPATALWVTLVPW